MKTFDSSELKKLYKPRQDSSGEQNGQVTIIGGSKLFHGAPLYGLTIASRIVDMVFFASPHPSLGKVAEKIKSKLLSFIWVPWEDAEAYIRKSDAVLIGPGFMRFGSERVKEADRRHNNHEEGILTRLITETLLLKFPKKRWMIDGGSLQVMDPNLVPENSILTPNTKEFEILFSVSANPENAAKMSKKYKCIIVLKGPETIVCSPTESVVVNGGNPGMTKGGTGDCLAGLTVSLLAKNDPFLAACTASYLTKAAADEIYEKVGVNYNSDDLADQIPQTFNEIRNTK